VELCDLTDINRLLGPRDAGSPSVASAILAVDPAELRGILGALGIASDNTLLRILLAASALEAGGSAGSARDVELLVLAVDVAAAGGRERLGARIALLKRVDHSVTAQVRRQRGRVGMRVAVAGRARSRAAAGAAARSRAASRGRARARAAAGAAAGIAAARRNGA